jgi:hypothetical protein
MLIFIQFPDQIPENFSYPTECAVISGLQLMQTSAYLKLSDPETVTNWINDQEKLTKNTI